MTSSPLERRTFATFRRAEFGFFGVRVMTCRQTPRRCGQPRKAGAFVPRLMRERPRRTNWLIVGIIYFGTPNSRSFQDRRQTLKGSRKRLALAWRTTRTGRRMPPDQVSQPFQATAGSQRKFKSCLTIASLASDFGKFFPSTRESRGDIQSHFTGPFFLGLRAD